MANLGALLNRQATEHSVFETGTNILPCTRAVLAHCLRQPLQALRILCELKPAGSLLQGGIARVWLQCLHQARATSGTSWSTSSYRQKLADPGISCVCNVLPLYDVPVQKSTAATSVARRRHDISKSVGLVALWQEAWLCSPVVARIALDPASAVVRL